MTDENNVALIVIKESNKKKDDNEVVLKWKGKSYTFQDLVRLVSYGGSSSMDTSGIHVVVDSSSSSSSDGRKRNRLEQLEVIVSTSVLLGAIGSWFLCSTSGYQAIFPSSATTGIVLKITIWLILLAIAITNQYHYWYPLHKTLHITLPLTPPTPTTSNTNIQTTTITTPSKKNHKKNSSFSNKKQLKQLQQHPTKITITITQTRARRRITTTSTPLRKICTMF